MRTLRTAGEVHAALAPARRGRTIGLVPTMGALHAGHLSLIRRAREACDEVVVSIFVNPAQFDDAADLAAYPRDEDRDVALASEAGADLVFAPAADEVYPPGFATSVQVGGITSVLEGAHRGAAHFAGVTTVVTKLLNVVSPDVAYFGQKDAQQSVVIRRLVRDLDLPVRIEVCPTVREPDGLALSSRNARLSAEERRRALAIPRALAAAGDLVAGGERDPDAILASARAHLDVPGVHVEYVALVDPYELEPVAWLSAPSLLAVAVRVGSTRLIDNALIEPAIERSQIPSPPPTRTEPACNA